MNLVMIGRFKTEDDAKSALELLEQLQNGLSGKIDFDSPRDRYSDEVLDLMRRLNCHNLTPSELGQFSYDYDCQLEGDTIILTTEESDVSAFFKTMIEKGARVEMFSAHDYSDTNYGRGK